jgi:hypothetical protein
LPAVCCQSAQGALSRGPRNADPSLWRSCLCRAAWRVNRSGLGALKVVPWWPDSNFFRRCPHGKSTKNASNRGSSCNEILRY